MDQANQLEPQIGLTGSYIIQLLAPFTTTQPECWYLFYHSTESKRL